MSTCDILALGIIALGVSTSLAIGFFFASSLRPPKKEEIIPERKEGNVFTDIGISEELSHRFLDDSPQRQSSFYFPGLNAPFIPNKTTVEAVEAARNGELEVCESIDACLDAHVMD